MYERVQRLGDMHHETLPELFTLECDDLDKCELIEQETAVPGSERPDHISVNIHSINLVSK